MAIFESTARLIKDWELFFGRTKDGQEIGFIIKTPLGEVYAFEAKYAIHGVSKAMTYLPAFRKELNPKSPLVIVTSGGQKLQLGADCLSLPIAALHDYLHKI